ncbi:ranBP-type and C3HC4-type zinc finger-containing protein 1-like isoform X1 [Asterias rubens]|uniref:ranBP-type and C3HC4-type zinc finger-containing protein 1-like isoform X1 n=2 Tax=Asterias rubens TaxID=7604 RepID=UPI001455BADF|nr:ranBP-type and C3HC4-type zinc finger-containing protein 1-like isoform X1 [Asterias rubens]XP_033625841.1 ranBP-type and C3HC4-type zinc finger-containing protein 1-like isoform X1 [Asterias rubens]
MMKSSILREEIILVSKGKLLQFVESQHKWEELHSAVKFHLLRLGDDFILRISTDGPESVLVVEACTSDIVGVKPMSEKRLQVDLGTVRFCLQFNTNQDMTQFSLIIKNVLDEVQSRAGLLRQYSPAMAMPNTKSTKGADIEALIESMTRAIASGDCESASHAAISLAQHKVKLSTQADEIGDMPGNRSKFNLDVVLEDRLSSGTKIRLPDVIPNMTIAYLKKLVFQMYDFPVEVQRWIIGQKIIKDTESLIDLRVNSSTPVFIYLISAEKAGITRQGVEVGRQALLEERQQQALFHQAGNASMFAPPPSVIRTKPVVRVPKNDLPNVVPSVAPQAAPPPRKRTAAEVGWHCPACTLINPPRVPGCNACMTERPDDYDPPAVGSYIMDDAEKRIQDDQDRNDALMMEMDRQDKIQEQKDRGANYQMLVETDVMSLVPNTEMFQCLICFGDVPQGEGVMLRECLHTFCRECLQENIRHNTEPVIMCPYQDGDYSCPEVIIEREIKALVGSQEFQQYLNRGLAVAENQASNAFHCKTPDCTSFCFYDDNINFFPCPVCNKQNCLTCKAIHEGMNCKEYQEDLLRRSANDQAAKKTKLTLEKMIKTGEAINCPQCGIIMLKKEGCDWVRCSMCKTEVCWVTKGLRWGPAGNGDITGGCKCRVQGRKCHINCQNCH